MKRKVFFIVLVCAIVGGIFAAIIISSTGIFELKKDKETLITDNESKTEYVNYVVAKGTLEIAGTLDGIVIDENDNSYIECSVSKAGEINFLHSIGEYLKKGEVICTVGSEKITMPDDGKIIGITDSEKEVIVGIYDYSNSKIYVNIPEEYQNNINYKSEIIYVDGEKEEYLKILKIIPEIIDGCFTIELENKFEMFNGTHLDLSIVYDKFEEVVYVPNGFIMTDSQDKKYVIVNDGIEYKTVYVDTGIENGKYSELLNADFLVGKTIAVDRMSLVLKDWNYE